jgi:hypothetical protein
MKRFQGILAYVALSLLFALAFGLGTASGQEATTAAETSATCCTIRVNTFDLAPNGTSLRVTVDWIRSDGSLKEQRAFGVTDGDDATVTDNFLWGNGAGSQPVGLMTYTMFEPAGETGASIKARFNKRVLTWLRDNGRIGASEITIP